MNQANKKSSVEVVALAGCAVLLAIAVFLVPSGQQLVFADGGMTHSGGDYVMTIGKVQKSPEQYPEDLLYVIDVGVKMMAVYSIDPQNRRIVPRDFKDLKTLTASTATNQNPAPSTRGVRPPQPPRNP